jgi:hypothetical protein
VPRTTSTGPRPSERAGSAAVALNVADHRGVVRLDEHALAREGLLERLHRHDDANHLPRILGVACFDRREEAPGRLVLPVRP